MSYKKPFQLINEIYTGQQTYNQNYSYPNFTKNTDKEFDKKKLQEEALIDKLKKEQNKKIGFDLSLLKRDELHVNLIHFDLKITYKENYEFYNKFKVDVVGGYLAMDNIYMLILYLEAIKNKNIPFIVISSGSSGNVVIPHCRKYTFIKEVIIFCGNYKYNEHYLKEYPGYVKKIFTNIRDVYKYIQSFEAKYDQGTIEFKKSDHFIFSQEDIQMNKQLEQCPVISAYEYDNCYFLIHRVYAHFFGNMNDKKNFIFTKPYFNIIRDYINKSDNIKGIYKPKLIKQFETLVNKPNFAELAMRLYTEESSFCYIFNRTMRNFEKGSISLAYYMGPFLFSLNKYVKENPINFKFNNDLKLYRNIQCSIFDFYLYKMNLNHIVCFPSITSTSLIKGQFKKTALSKKINEIDPKNMINITMIFIYNHKESFISPGIMILNNKGKDEEYISSKKEYEVILLPFTFARITKIIEVSKKDNTFEIYFEIINRNHYIEYTLRDNVEKRDKFSSLD